MRGLCKYFKNGRCLKNHSGDKYACDYKYPEFKDCEDFEESEE